MGFEKYLRQKQIEKEAAEAASKFVNKVLSNSYARSEFEKNRYWIGLFKTDVEFNGLLGEFGRYELNGSRDVNHSYLEDFNSKWEAYAKAWQHQQYKVDELQKKNAWLGDVAERENKRANKLQEENVNTTVLLGKTIQEKNELQKMVDEQTRHVEIALLAVKDIYKSAIDEFHGWDVLNEKAPKLCEHLQNLSVTIVELEQALKGDY